MAELKRILSKKIIIMVVLLVCANLFVFYSEQQKGLKDFNRTRQDYIALVDEYRNMDLNEAVEKSQQLLTQIKNGESQTDQKAARQLNTKLKYLAEYGAEIEKVFENADKIERLSFMAKKGTFSYNNVMKTRDDFTNLKGLELSLDNDVAVSKMISYSYTNYFAIVAGIVILYVLMKYRQKDIMPIIRTASNGRLTLALKQMVLVNGIMAGIHILLYGSCVLFSLLLYGGAGDLTGPVQTIESCRNYCNLISKLDLIVIMELANLLVIFLVVLLFWLIMLIIKNRNHAMLVVSVIIGVEFVLYNKFGINSAYAYLHHFNIMNLFDIQNIICTYKNFGSGNFIASVSTVVIIAGAGAFVLCSALVVLISARKKIEGKKSLFAVVSEKIGGLVRKLLFRLPVWLLELYKLLFTRKGILIILALLFVSVYFTTSNIVIFAEADIESDRLCTEYGGRDYSKMEEIVEEVYAAVDSAKAEVEEATAAFERGEITNMELIKAGTKLYGANLEVMHYSTVIKRIEHTKAVGGYLMPENGYSVLFGKFSTTRRFIVELAILVGILVIVIDSFSYEKTSGMNKIINSAANGHKKYFTRKVLCCMALAVLVNGIIYFTEYMTMNSAYGFTFLEAPVRSLTFMEDFADSNLTVGGYIIIEYLILVVWAMFITSISLFVSSLSKKQGSQIGICVVLVLAVIFWLAVNGLSFKIRSVLALGTIVLSVILVVLSYIMIYGRKKSV